MGKTSIRGGLPAKAPGQSTELMLRLRLRRSACLPVLTNLTTNLSNFSYSSWARKIMAQPSASLNLPPLGRGWRPEASLSESVCLSLCLPVLTTNLTTNFSYPPPSAQRREAAPRSSWPSWRVGEVSSEVSSEDRQTERQTD